MGQYYDGDYYASSFEEALEDGFEPDEPTAYCPRCDEQVSVYVTECENDNLFEPSHLTEKCSECGGEVE